MLPYDSKRTLLDRASGKTWHVERQQNQLVMANGTGKARIKEMADEDQANKQIEKEIWTRLKKGFIYRDEHAEPGRPALHLYRGAGYTGFMPLAVSTDHNDFYTAYVVGQFECTEIRKYNALGDELITITLANNHMIYDMKWDADREQLLLNDSHQMFSLDLQGGGAQSLSGNHMPNNLDLAEGRSVWREGNEAVVIDRASDQVLLRIPVNPAMFGGHSPQFAVGLSSDGKQLAIADQLTSITVYDVDSGEEKHNIKRDEDLCQRLIFSTDGQTLYVHGVYAYSNLLAYDLNKTSDNEVWKVEAVKHMAADAVRGWVALYRYKHVEIYDQQDHRMLMRFPLEHVVKHVKMAFTRDYLAVYSDYGCISLYKLP